MDLRREPGYLLFGRDTSRYSWRGVGWFALTYFGAFLAAAVLGPLVYAWVMGLPAPADPDGLLAYLQEKPLARYVDRVRLLFAAGTLLWLIGACGLWGRFGFNWKDGGLRTFAVFYLLGVVSLGAVVAGQALFAGPVADGALDGGRILKVLANSLAGGLLLGWLEEAVFRGMLLRMFYTAVRPLAAVVLSALVFAAVHFKGVPPAVQDGLHWYSGLVVAGYMSVSFFLTVDWLEFANYFLVGVVLNLVFLRTGSLVGCMALHAGWVLVRNSWGKLAELEAGPHTLIWGTERIVDGWATLIILAAIAIGLYVETRRHQGKSRPGMAQPA